MAKTRRAYTGGAASTTTSSAIASSGTTSFTITAYTGWPYGADPFFVVVEPGTANEEKMLVVRSGSTDTTLSVYSTPSVAANRGMDGTSAVAHSSGATIYPVFTALDADEANELASTLTTKGDLLAHNASTFTRLGVGANDTLLVADSGEATGIKWATVDTGSLADGAVTTAKLEDDAVTNAKVAADAVDTAQIVDKAVTAAKLADLTTNAQVGSYTLVLADAGKIVEMNVGSANNLTVPPNSSVAFPVGTQLLVLQTGAGQTTLVAGAGVTINSKDGDLKLSAQWSAASLVKRATNTWVAVGDLTS
jgi:hypothetical protein